MPPQRREGYVAKPCDSYKDYPIPLPTWKASSAAPVQTAAVAASAAATPATATAASPYVIPQRQKTAAMLADPAGWPQLAASCASEAPARAENLSPHM